MRNLKMGPKDIYNVIRNLLGYKSVATAIGWHELYYLTGIDAL